MIHKYDSPTTFFFLDPPYENTDKSFEYADNDFDFERLRDICNTIKGTFMLTLNDSPYIRKLFKDYVIKKINVIQNFQSNNPIRKELIIMNYTLP